MQLLLLLPVSFHVEMLVTNSHLVTASAENNKRSLVVITYIHHSDLQMLLLVIQRSHFMFCSLSKRNLLLIAIKTQPDPDGFDIQAIDGLSVVVFLEVEEELLVSNVVGYVDEGLALVPWDADPVLQDGVS